MSNSGSTGSFTDSTSYSGGCGGASCSSSLGGTLQIPNYHFKGAPIPSLAHGENVDIVFGYRISNKKPVVAKVSPNSLRLEREYYIMKRLYQLGDGPSFLVRPLEYINLPSGLTVVIYADEGQNYLDLKKQSEENNNSNNNNNNNRGSVGSDRGSSVGSEPTVGYESSSIPNERRRYRHHQLENSYNNNNNNDSIYNSHLPSTSSSSQQIPQSTTTDITNLGGGGGGGGGDRGPAFDLCTFLRFAIKCTDCLEFVHRNNTVHGEVRLSAFQWAGEDSARVKMWNFGSGSKSLETYLTSEGWRKTAVNKDSMNLLHNLLVYMSPEQTGRTTYVPDHRSDIYSLGIVFFVLLTGRNPFDGGPLEILNSILSRKIPLVHEIQLDVPEVVARIVEKMTYKSPDDRYSSAYGVRADLKECLRRLRTGTDTSREAIESFPLAERDIASVFTLPKTIYGRQTIIVEMTYVIERVAGVYRLLRNRREKSHTTSSTIPTSSDIQASNASISDGGVSDSLSSHDVGSIIGAKSAASPSYCSGGLDSDVSSSNGRISGSKQGVEIISISGPGGVGKSTLFSAVQMVARQHGYVATTKYDSRHKVPYSCILRSLSQILQQILSESEEEIHLFYNHLKLHLGAQFYNIELLADLVPELRPLLDPVDNEDGEEPINAIHLDNVETRIRFHSLFIEVFRALTQWRMVTLFIDDLHLADDPSLELIESMISSRLKILIFIAYRDQEVTETLEKLLLNEYAVFHRMRVDALDFESLVDYICDALHRPHDIDRDSILPLADIIYKKTRGNAFYTAQLIATLEKKKFIFFNWEENEWDYNLNEIQQAILSNDGSERDGELDINFLVARLKELPLDGQRLLKWASFVGDTFSWNTVKNLMIHSDPESECSDTDSTTTATISTIGGGEEENAGGASASNRNSVIESLHPIIKFSHHTTEKSQSSSNGSAKNSKLSVTSSHRSRDPINGLQAALQEGYILPLESDEFKWSHDRYSQAAMELANPKTREKIHLKIAQYLMNEERVDSFLVSDHLIKCLNLVIDLQDKTTFRDILYEAGNRARSSGAHKMAFSYYKAAIKLLNHDEAWDDNNYSSTHYLYSNAVSLSWVVGEYETTEEYLEIIFDHATDPMDRVTAYRIQHKYYFARQMHDEGADALKNCLKELDIEEFEFDSSRENLDYEYCRVKDIINRVGFEELHKIGSCDSAKLKAIMGILEEMCTAAYWLGNQTEMFYLASKLVHLSLTRGMSSVSGVALVFLGLAAVEVYSEFSFGEELGAVGVVVSDRFGGNSEKGRAYFLYANFLLQWKHHLRDAFAWYRSSLRFCLSAGDRIYASFAHLHIATTAFYCGENMSDTLVEAETCYDDIHAWSSSVDTNILIMAIIRTVKAFQGHTFNDSPEEIFDGDDGFNDKHFVSESCKQSANPDVPLNWYDSFRMIPLVLYGHYEEAISVGYMCLRGIHNHPCHRHTRMMIMLQSLAIINKLRAEKDTLSEEAVEMYKERIDKNQGLLRPWVEHSRVNYVMWYTLVEAERASLGSDFPKCARLYEEAIDQAREGGWYIDLCICHEYAGTFYESVGMKNVAYGLLKKAVSLYINHGSYGKAHHLNVKFSSLLSEYDDDRIETHEVGIQTDPFPFLGPQGTWSTSSMANVNTINEPFVSETIPPVTTEQTLLTLDILDMASILKSSQVISSEVKFDSLLKSMMSIILENSGADCGAIIVKEEKYGMCAYGSQLDGAMTFDPPRQLSEDDSLVSSRIIHHTINTGESIFIHNVEQDARFAIGPWYEHSGSKSVICMPIIHKSALVGCLIIEGSSGIFTQRHVTVLSLLCQQMGISITNAFLFKSVQRVTMANMRMIEMQKKALEDARKSKEAAVRATRLREIFLANMSHEIRTPFSGFYGMISLLTETDLDSEQRDLVKTAKESCEILLQIIDDLLNFSKLQAGKVTLDLSPVVVEDVIADVVEMLIAMAIQKNINIAYVVAENVPPVVMADGNRLRQVIINLLGNAIKFTHEGEIRILCSLDTKNQPKDGVDQVSLLFEVIDTGIGISNEQRKVLFEPFSQVDGSTTRKYGGTGLGLSICLQLVQLMSGTINVSSTPGKGSNFFFTVNVSKIRNQTGRSIRSDTFEEQKQLLKSISQVRVLAISKYAATITMIRHLLPGIYVDGVHHIDEFLVLASKNKYDVIIVGLFMNPETIKVSSSWLEDASKINPKGLIIIMNYPAGGMNQKSRWIEPVSNQQLKCKTVRMAVPLRRLKITRTIAEMLEKDVPSNSPKVVKTKAASLITDEERSLYSTLNILIAEDNPVAQKLLLKQLTRLGFTVECANNGLEAVNAWSNHPINYFTMAFFDHHMPKCDGVAATKRIREIEQEENRSTRFPIVALTADVQESAKQICMAAGMDGYLTKPLNQKVLAEALRRYCLPSSKS